MSVIQHHREGGEDPVGLPGAVPLDMDTRHDDRCYAGCYVTLEDPVPVADAAAVG